MRPTLPTSLVSSPHTAEREACAYSFSGPAAIAGKLEWHYTPRHGSWLNVAEVELAALSKQCLGRRIGTKAELERRVGVWEEERNQRFAETK